MAAGLGSKKGEIVHRQVLAQGQDIFGRGAPAMEHDQGFTGLLQGRTKGHHLLFVCIHSEVNTCQ